MGSDDGPKHELKLVILVMNCVVCHGTPVDTFIDLSKTAMWHLKIVSNSDYITSNEWMLRNNELKNVEEGGCGVM